jgi:NTE family protein
MQLLNILNRKPKRLGIVLGGGAARGAAHIGVLQVLEREGIVPDVVVGTSVGAAVGAAYAAGVSTTEISRLFHSVRWRRLARLGWRNRLSLLDAEPLEALIQASIGISAFEQLPRPFAAVACDLLTGQRIVLQTGPLARAVCASAAIPGLFPPVELDDWLLIDGGVVDNLPVDVARELGADYVIAVDLFPLPTGQQRPANLFEMLIAAGSLWSRANHPDPTTIDCYILPAIGDYLPWDFSVVPELEARGRAAAEQAIVRLKADLGLDR